jgi:hypothetical protein
MRGMFAVVTIALAASGCSFKTARIERALLSYQRTLRLEVALIDNFPVVGSGFELRLMLTNVSPSETVRACLGSSRSFVLTADPAVPGRKSIDEDRRVVEHPGCVRRFELGPGTVLEWVDRANVNIGPGVARLSASVSVIHPTDCDRDGCHETEIKAPDVRLSLR